MKKAATSRTAGALAVIVVAAALAAGAWMMFRADPLGHAPAAGRADANDPARVARGAAVYKDHCAVCHGADLEGQANWRARKPDGRLPAPPHDTTGHTWHHPDDHLFRMTKYGLAPPLAPEGYESDMPAFAGVLSDEEIWAVLAYIKSTWSARERAFQERLNRKTEDANR